MKNITAYLHISNLFYPDLHPQRVYDGRRGKGAYIGKPIPLSVAIEYGVAKVSKCLLRDQHDRFPVRCRVLGENGLVLGKVADGGDKVGDGGLNLHDLENSWYEFSWIY